MVSKIAYSLTLDEQPVLSSAEFLMSTQSTYLRPASMTNFYDLVHTKLFYSGVR